MIRFVQYTSPRHDFKPAPYAGMKEKAFRVKGSSGGRKNQIFPEK